MSMIEEKLVAMGYSLPTPVAPIASYVPAVQSGSLLFISGQIPIGPAGPQHIGRLGDNISVEEGQAAAALCALNVLAQAKAALGSLDRISRVVRVGGFVAATPDFTDHPAVINGASDLFLAAFGDAGRHARAAVGCSSLPRGVAVEVEALFEVR